MMLKDEFVVMVYEGAMNALHSSQYSQSSLTPYKVTCNKLMG